MQSTNSDLASQVRVDVLRAAQAHLSDRSNWTQGTLYKGECSCLMGAIVRKLYKSDRLADSGPYWSFLDQVAYKEYGVSVIHVNDNLGYVAAMEVLKMAIEDAQAVRT